MKVVILCGGRGTRLREETEFRPKPMVPIGGKPILWHIMKTYAAQGFREFVLCLGYKGDMIKDYFRNYMWNTCDVTLSLGKTPSFEYHTNHEEEHWRVTLVDTGLDSLTARRIKLIQPYIEPSKPFLLTYGDGVSNIDVAKSIQSHKDSGKALTLTAVRPAGRFGALIIEDDGNIKHFMEKPQHENVHVNGGFMVASHEIFDYLTDDNIMFEQEPIQNLVKDGKVNSFPHEGFWQPMDTYQESQYLNKLWAAGNAPWKLW